MQAVDTTHPPSCLEQLDQHPKLQNCEMPLIQWIISVYRKSKQKHGITAVFIIRHMTLDANTDRAGLRLPLTPYNTMHPIYIQHVWHFFIIC